MTAVTMCGKCRTDNMHFQKFGGRAFWKCKDCGRIEGCNVPRNPYRRKAVKKSRGRPIKRAKFFDERTI